MPEGFQRSRWETLASDFCVASLGVSRNSLINREGFGANPPRFMIKHILAASKPPSTHFEKDFLKKKNCEFTVATVALWLQKEHSFLKALLFFHMQTERVCIICIWMSSNWWLQRWFLFLTAKIGRTWSNMTCAQKGIGTCRCFYHLGCQWPPGWWAQAKSNSLAPGACFASQGWNFLALEPFKPCIFKWMGFFGDFQASSNRWRDIFIESTWKQSSKKQGCFHQVPRGYWHTWAVIKRLVVGPGLHRGWNATQLCRDFFYKPWNKDPKIIQPWYFMVHVIFRVLWRLLDMFFFLHHHYLEDHST